jgi:hypothetical protein
MKGKLIIKYISIILLIVIVIEILSVIPPFNSFISFPTSDNKLTIYVTLNSTPVNGAEVQVFADYPSSSKITQVASLTTFLGYASLQSFQLSGLISAWQGNFNTPTLIFFISYVEGNKMYYAVRAQL